MLRKRVASVQSQSNVCTEYEGYKVCNQLILHIEDSTSNMCCIRDRKVVSDIVTLCLLGTSTLSGYKDMLGS